MLFRLFEGHSRKQKKKTCWGKTVFRMWSQIFEEMDTKLLQEKSAKTKKKTF